MVSERSELNQWFVYILKCKNGDLYTGITDNVQRRFEEHVSGKGGHFTKSFVAEEILFSEKHPPGVKIEEVFPDTWEAYIGYSKMLIKNNMKDNDNICVVADFLGKPKTSNKYYEPEIRVLPVVYNATVLESHASLFIQLVDVMIGCIVLDFKRSRQLEKKVDAFKGKICDFLKGKLEIESLAGNFTKHEPNYFSVWEFKPKQK